MKKAILISLSLCAALSLSGCFAEDYSFCPPEEPAVVNNVTIHFTLPDPATGQGDTFLEDCKSATTAIYDNATGALVETFNTDAANHAEFKGVRFYIEPGTYRVISWANSGTNTQINGQETALSGTYSYLNYKSVNNGVTGDGDALYFAPTENNAPTDFIMTVDSETGYEGTLTFHHAHRRVEVYVAGFVASNGVNTPLIRLTGLPSEMTFTDMQSTSDSNLFITSELDSQMVSVNYQGETKPYALSPIHVFYLNTADYNIGVEIADPATGQTIYTTPLNDHITGDNPAEEISMQLLVEFVGADVSVSVPSWNSEDVDYGWWD